MLVKYGGMATCIHRPTPRVTRLFSVVDLQPVFPDFLSRLLVL